MAPFVNTNTAALPTTDAVPETTSTAVPLYSWVLLYLVIGIMGLSVLAGIFFFVPRIYRYCFPALQHNRNASVQQVSVTTASKEDSVMEDSEEKKRPSSYSSLFERINTAVMVYFPQEAGTRQDSKPDHDLESQTARVSLNPDKSSDSESVYSQDSSPAESAITSEQSTSSSLASILNDGYLQITLAQFPLPPPIPASHIPSIMINTPDNISIPADSPEAPPQTPITASYREPSEDPNFLSVFGYAYIATPAASDDTPVEDNVSNVSGDIFTLGAPPSPRKGKKAEGSKEAAIKRANRERFVGVHPYTVEITPSVEVAPPPQAVVKASPPVVGIGRGRGGRSIPPTVVGPPAFGRGMGRGMGRGSVGGPCGGISRSPCAISGPASAVGRANHQGLIDAIAAKILAEPPVAAGMGRFGSTRPRAASLSTFGEISLEAISEAE
ncbi:hypothetical protein ABKN59_009187 [Abortiporus biennis]